LRSAAGRQLLLAAAVFGIPYFANIGARFLIPVVPFVALALGIVLEFSPALIVILLLAHAAISWPGAIRFYSASAGCWNLAGVPVKAALRFSPEEEFLGKRLGIYGIARMVDRFVPPDSRVLSFDPVAEAYTTRNVMIAYQSAEGNLEQDILFTPSILEFQPTWRLDFQFPSTQLRAVRVLQTASRAPDLWSVSELRLFQNGAELPRRAQWRMRAHPFPWDVTLAFDNSPVTRWRSWRALDAGMFLEVDFGKAETVDRVLLEASHDQYKIDLHLEGKDQAGVWRRLAGSPASSDSAPLPNLRRTASAELKARGTGYLLIEDSHRFAKDFQLNRGLWGMTPLGEWSGARLYRID
ncbi:MAG: discoidin domain-containing protein, partial [Acidobacteriota bacterium]|nr:discoidin domain-containing protein [Acidobacteriota bacterium]